MPISSHYGIIAVDKRKMSIIGNEATEKDNGYLNSIQVSKCLKYVYSNHDLSEHIGEGKVLTKWFEKERPQGFVDVDSWKPEFINFDVTFPEDLSF